MNSDYTFVHAFLGGGLIGAASLIAAGASGKIPGISGLFSRVLRPRQGDTLWRVLFLLGLVAGAAVGFAFIPSAQIYRPQHSWLVLAFAGVLVGLGTRIGGGCTSGHGVCGIGLGSRSAIIATVVFMAAGMLTVFALNHTPLSWHVR